MIAAVQTSSPFDLTPVRAEAQPAFVDVPGCRRWLLELPITDVARTSQLVTAQLVPVADADLPPDLRLEIAEVVRPHVVLVQEQLARRFRGRPAPLSRERRALFRDVCALWDALARVYLRCLESWIGSGADPELQSLACARAIDAVARKLREHHHAYVRVSGADLRLLHRLYGCAERGGFVRQRVPDALATEHAPATNELLYVRALLLHAATPREHRPTALAVVARWVDQWATRAKVLITAPESPTVAPLWADLDGDGGLVRDGSRGPAWRAFDVSALAASLAKRIHALRHGKKPAEMDLGNDLDRREFESLLLSLQRQWCEGTPRRQHARETLGAPAHVSTGLAAAHFYLSRRPFEQPFARVGLPQGDDASVAVERIRAATQYMLAHGIVGEEWSVRNESVTGIGLVRPMGEREGASLSHGLLLSVRPRGGGSVLVATLQWMEEASDGDLHVGAKLVPGVPTPIAARGMGQDDFFPALMLAPIAALNAPSSVLLPPGTYARDRIVEIFVKGIDRIQLTGLLDSGADYERAAYMPAGTSHAPP